MSLDLEPLELLTVAVSAVMLALPISFPLAASAIATPRRIWNGAGLTLGLSLLLGVVAALAAHFLALGASVQVAAGVVHLVGLVLALAAAVFIVIRSDGSRVTAAVGIVACLLIGLGETSRILPELFEISPSILAVGAGAVIEAVVVAVFVGALVAAAGRVRALQVGIAGAGAVAALMIGISSVMHLVHELGGADVSGVPVTSQLTVIVVVLVIGTIVGAVLESRSGQRGDLEAGGSQA